MPWQAKFLLLAGIWGSSFLLMKIGLRSSAPLQIAGLRILAGVGCALGPAVPHRRRPPARPPGCGAT